MRRGSVFALLGMICSGAAVLFACSSSDNNTAASCDAGTSTSPDSGSGGVDSGGPSTDAGGDAGNPNQPDADASSSSIQSALGATARIRLFVDAVFAEFKQDDTILRDPGTPECVAHLWSDSKPFSQGGNITIGGPIVGADGGPAAAIVVAATNGDPGWQYATFADPGTGIYPADDNSLVQVTSAGTPFVPALPVQSLRPSPATPVAVTAPAPPDGGALSVSSTQDLAITWTAPANAKSDARLVFGFWEIGGSTHKKGSIYCGFPLSKGSAKVPQSLLSALRTALGTNAKGQMHVWVGGQTEFTTGGVSYVVEVARADSTNLTTDFDATLE